MAEYIYILINPSIGGLLKIGRTSRSPEERAKELSASTGVPTPFIVAYEEQVVNSMIAEKLIHEQIAAIGYRINDAREFFSMPLKKAISVVAIVCGQLNRSEIAAGEASADVSDNSSDYYHNKGLSHLFGDNHELQNYGFAKECFLKAIAFGGSDSYQYLAQLHLWGLGCSKSTEEALLVLKAGGDRGSYICYFKMWQIYSGVAINEFSSSDDLEAYQGSVNNSNADICFQWYMDALEGSIDIDHASRYLTNTVNSASESAREILRASKGIKYSSERFPGKHSQTLLTLWAGECIIMLRDMKHARLSGILITEMSRAAQYKYYSPSILMKLQEFIEKHTGDPELLLRKILSDHSEQDLSFCFSRLPEPSIKANVAKFTNSLKVKNPAPDKLLLCQDSATDLQPVAIYLQDKDTPTATAGMLGKFKKILRLN